MGNHKPPSERRERTGVDSRIEGRARGLGRGLYYFRGLAGLEAKLQVQKEEECSGNGRKVWNVNADLGKGHGAVGGSLQLLPLHMTPTPFSLFGSGSRDWLVDAPPRRFP